MMRESEINPVEFTILIQHISPYIINPSNPALTSMLYCVVLLTPELVTSRTYRPNRLVNRKQQN